MRLRKGITYIFIANLINLVVNSITGFILPNILSINTYANISLFQLYITYVGILHFGYSDGIYLKYGGRNIEDIEPKEIYDEFNTFKLFQLFITIIAVFISIIIGNKILVLCALSILPINISNYLRNLYQATGRFDKYAKFTNINTLLLFVMNIVLLFIIKSDYFFSYLLAYVIAYFAYWIFLEIEVGKIVPRIKAKANIKFLRQNIKDGFSLMVGNFCSVLLTSVDRLFVKNLMSLAEFAYFSFAVSIESLINIFVTPMTIILYNFFCKFRDKNKIMFVKNTTLLLVSLLISSAFIAKFIIANYIGKYSPSIPILFILFIAQYFSIIIRSIYSNLYKAQKRQNKYLKVVVIVIALSILLNILFYIFNQSIISIALSTMATSIIWFFACELDFVDYRCRAKEYAYIFTIASSFLISGIFFNPISGLLIYALVLTLATLLFMRSELKDLINEIHILVSSIRRRNI